MSGVPQRNDPGNPNAPSELGVRVLLMVLFGCVFSLLAGILTLTALAQLLTRLASGRPSADLSRFGSALARYTYQVIEYLTFATDTPPYPLSSFPA